MLICSKGPGQHCSSVAVPHPQLGLCSEFVRKLMSFTCPYHVLALSKIAAQIGLGGRLEALGLQVGSREPEG